MQRFKRRLLFFMWLMAIVMVYRVLMSQCMDMFRLSDTRHMNTIHTLKNATIKETSFIVIDSGHGFFDAGKIGVSGSEEKTINLAIAKKLKIDLEAQGLNVQMTRENDNVLYDGTRPINKKEDMSKRTALMNAKGCLLAVSIHQNSFTEEKYKGAQVFYYEVSEESRKLAETIQKALAEFQDPENKRLEKGNEDYYLLRKGTVPTVICECGFLSNASEEAMLCSEDYQEKTAWAISVGIVRYLNDNAEER